MPRTVTNASLVEVAVEDDAILIASASGAGVTVTLPFAADALGRTYSIHKQSDAAFSVSVSTQAGDTLKTMADAAITNPLIATGDKYTGIYVVQSGASTAWKLVTKPTVTATAPTLTTAGGDYLLKTDPASMELTLPDIPSNAANGSIKITLRHHSSTGSNTLKVRSNISGETITWLTYTGTEEIVAVNSWITIPVGRSLTLYNKAGVWRDVRRDIFITNGADVTANTISTQAASGVYNHLVRSAGTYGGTGGQRVVTLPTIVAATHIGTSAGRITISYEENAAVGNEILETGDLTQYRGYRIEAVGSGANWSAVDASLTNVSAGQIIWVAGLGKKVPTGGIVRLVNWGLRVNSTTGGQLRTSAGTSQSTDYLTAPGSRTYTAVKVGSSMFWQADNYTKTLAEAVTVIGTSASAPTVLTEAEIIPLSASASGKYAALPATASTAMQLKNTGTTNAVNIVPPSGKRLFSSGGYIDSYSLGANRSATFIYSAGLDAWVKA